MNTYKAFYKGKQIEVTAFTSLGAQTIAAKEFRAKKSYDVTVILLAKEDKPVIHKPQDICP